MEKSGVRVYCDVVGVGRRMIWGVLGFSAGADLVRQGPGCGCRGGK